MDLSLFEIRNIMIIAGIITAILIVGSVGLIFFKRCRKIGIGILITLFAIAGIAVVYFYFPRNFKRNYLVDSFDSNRVYFRGYADALNFHIGAIGDTTTIPDPEFCGNLNSITLETALKMGSLLKNNTIGEYDFSAADSIVDLALEKKLRIRGHTLIWGKLSNMFKAPDLDAYLNKFPEQERRQILQDIVENHITTVLNHYKGKIYTWDVVNEPLDSWGAGELENNVFYRYLGENYIAWAFQLAHSIDPGLKLYLNEIFSSYKGKRTESFYELVKALKAKQVPIHGVGIQAHIMLDTAFAPFTVFMQRITDLGLEVEITELDARLVLFQFAKDPYQAQGEFYAEMLKICLNNPLCKGITFWGFSDNDCWYDDQLLAFPKPNEPYLFDAHMHPKPAFNELYKTFKGAFDAGLLRPDN